ncbi:NPC intracellular cholesterol transporter 2 homolog a [Apis mellifera]|uniref:NPC intracellular cholesterol transporter 2 homolog a n=1 Tax=Apis mellifera TaxID=7460 RepID=A0A7M7TFS9_APIME|nr:NPC intracellular cholesterol transporter 2 homolog a [Apis mellifera]|eukprot:XP_624310.2 NPC intracellular cholesterol transporter 2 homolog a [Apis mellifera]
MYRMIVIILIVCLCFSPMYRAINIDDCGSKVGKLTSITLDCDMTKSVCDLIPDTNATIRIDFTLEKDVSKVNAIVHGIVMDIPIPFPLPNADACQTPDSGITCPLNKGETYHYKNTLPVHKSYPKVSVTVKWQLKDENNEDIICVLIPARIK